MKKADSDEVRLNELEKVDADIIDLNALKKFGIVRKDIRFVAVINTGTITKAVTVKGLRLTKGAKAAILAAGGKVVEE